MKVKSREIFGMRRSRCQIRLTFPSKEISFSSQYLRLNSVSTCLMSQAKSSHRLIPLTFDCSFDPKSDPKSDPGFGSGDPNITKASINKFINN